MASCQQSVEELFGAALECPPEERGALLDRCCANAPELRRLVEELLLANSQAGSFLEKPHPALLQARLAAPAAHEIVMIPAAQASPRGRFEPGQIIAGRFTVVRFLACGGMGEVYEVSDGFLQGVHVALKLILPALATNHSATHRFEQEVLLARKVNHPNLCPIYDISLCHDPAPPFLFLTMKLLEGETLAARLRRQAPFTVSDHLAIACQLTSGLAAIHSAGVIHRDIKPNNVMLLEGTAELRLSLMDFGLARLHEAEATALTQSNLAGTPGYLAPELYLGHAPAQATDLYALGVVLHQVLTGCLPLTNRETLAIEPAPSLALAECPVTLRLAVNELLAPEPKRRCLAFERLHAWFGLGPSALLHLAASNPASGPASHPAPDANASAASGAGSSAASDPHPDAALHPNAPENGAWNDHGSAARSAAPTDAGNAAWTNSGNAAANAHWPAHANAPGNAPGLVPRNAAANAHSPANSNGLAGPAHAPLASPAASSAPEPRRSRRAFLVTGSLAAASLAGVALLGRDRLFPSIPDLIPESIPDLIEDSIADLLHPLPHKRFVALLHWPPSPDPTLKAMLSGVIDAIAGELARAEAHDRDLFVSAQRTDAPLLTPAQLNEVRESLGANLILAASGASLGGSPSNTNSSPSHPTKDAQGHPQGGSGPDSPHDQIELTLRVLTPSLGKPLREIRLRILRDRQSELSERAVQAAARLLNVTRYTPDDQRSRPSTDSAEALAAYQSAEALRKQPNDTGLDAAIEKYKQAVEIDPRYAAAYARLARAYFHLYNLHRDPAALALARANCQSALKFEPGSVEASLVLAWVLERSGDLDGALREIKRALLLDPFDSNTLVSQGAFYADLARWSDAEAAYAAAVRMRPNSWLGHHELAVILSRQGKYGQALTEFQSATLVNAYNAQASADLGYTYLQLGRLSEAVLQCRKSYALRPNVQAALALAEVYRVRGSYQQAIDFAKSALRLETSDPEAWVQLADCYSSSPVGRVEAVKAYTRARDLQQEQLQVEPKDGPGWMRLALCQAKTTNLKPILPMVVQAESLHADDLLSQLLKTRILAIIGHGHEALDTLARCAERGATAFQLATLPDVEVVRRNPLYRSTLGSKAVFDNAELQERS